MPDLPNNLPSLSPETLSAEERLRLRQVESGKLGGRSRSEAKRASSSANLRKARLKRWPGREVTQLTRQEMLDREPVGQPYTGDTLLRYAEEIPDVTPQESRVFQSSSPA